MPLSSRKGDSKIKERNIENGGAGIVDYVRIRVQTTSRVCTGHCIISSTYHSVNLQKR